MKKVLLMILAITILVLMKTDLVCAVNLNYEINNDRAAEYIAYYVLVCSNTETEEAVNPAYDPENTNPSIPPTIQVLKYTDAQWVKEHIRRHIIKQINRGRIRSKRDDRRIEDAADAIPDSDVGVQ